MRPVDAMFYKWERLVDILVDFVPFNLDIPNPRDADFPVNSGYFQKSIECFGKRIYVPRLLDSNELPTPLSGDADFFRKQLSKNSSFIYDMKHGSFHNLAAKYTLKKSGKSANVRIDDFSQYDLSKDFH